MIVKIQPPSSRMDQTLNYNETKADGAEGILEEEDISGTGHILVTRNVPPQKEIEDEFERLRILNIKKTRGRTLKNTAFHMSVNPGESDRRLGEKEIVKFIDEIMDKLGYGKCPYRIYRHSDIERTHFHVVSTRIGQDGKKVNDSFENTRLMNILTDLEQKFGFCIGSPKATERELPSTTETAEATKKTETKKKTAKRHAHAYSPDSGPLTEQLRLIHEEVITWNFTTEEQYAAIVQTIYRTRVQKQGDQFTYTGIRGSKPNTPALTEEELRIDATTEVNGRIEKTRALPSRRAQKERIQKNAREYAGKSKDWEEFTKSLEKKGIHIVLSWTTEGEPFGLTWLDRATKNAFKGSDTATDLDWLMETVRTKGWTIKPETKKKKTEKQQEKKKSTRRSIQPTDIGKAPSLASLASSLNNRKSHGTTTDASDFRDDTFREDKDNGIKI